MEKTAKKTTKNTPKTKGGRMRIAKRRAKDENHAPTSERQRETQ